MFQLTQSLDKSITGACDLLPAMAMNPDREYTKNTKMPSLTKQQHQECQTMPLHPKALGKMAVAKKVSVSVQLFRRGILKEDIRLMELFW
jgi:hypothetical protein